MRGEREYPGDSYVVSVMTEYMLEHVRQRHYENDVLASSELDNAFATLQKLRDSAKYSIHKMCEYRLSPDETTDT